MPIAKRAKDVIGSIEFGKFYDSIAQDDPRKKELLDVFKILKEDCLRATRYHMIVGLLHIPENTE